MASVTDELRSFVPLVTGCAGLFAHVVVVRIDVAFARFGRQSGVGAMTLKAGFRTYVSRWLSRMT